MRRLAHSRGTKALLMLGRSTAKRKRKKISVSGLWHGKGEGTLETFEQVVEGKDPALLAALVDNHLHHGNELGFDVRRPMWRRVVDMNDRALRNVTLGLGGSLGNRSGP